MKKIFSLLAAVLFAGGMFAADVTVEKTMSEIISENGYTVSAGNDATCYTSFSLDANITVSTSGEANCGSFWGTSPNNDWRLYQTKSGDITIAAADGMTLKTITITYSNSNNGTLLDGETVIASAAEQTINAASKTYTVGNTSTKTNGQVRVTKIKVVYEGEGGSIVPPSLAAGYYLVGSKMGWSAASGYKFDANPSADGEYILTTTLAVNDELKVIYFEDDDIVTWYPAGSNNNYVVDAAHAGDKTIYFRPAGNQAWADFHQGGFFFIEANPDLDNITTCAQAAAILANAENNVQINNGADYTLRGYVTSIATAYDARYGNISFWMADDADGGNVLEAFRCVPESAEALPEVGDLVEVTGKLKRYNSTPEFDQGCSCVIIEKGNVPDPENLGVKTIAEFLSLKNTVDTCVLTGSVKNIVMDSQDPTKPIKYGNFDLEDATATVYIYGLLTADGQAQKFQEMDIEEEDIITIKAIYSEYNSKPQVKNAILVSVQKAPTAIDNIEVVKTTKVIRNGQVVIIREGVEYNMLGTEVK